VIVFEPFYENYHPDTQLCGATRKLVSLRPPDWTFDPQELRAAFSGRTKAIIINTPNNPTGKVFSRSELEYIALLCQEYDALAITDEIYEHITYDGRQHIPMASLPGMRNRSVLVNSMSKTYSVTGWRVGWVLAAPDLTDSIRKVHDFLTVGAASPLQQAGVLALSLPDDYYVKLANTYSDKRDTIVRILTGAGFHCFQPHGAYYVMTDISGFGYANDTGFARYMVEEVGVAAVPGSSFYHNSASGSQQIRFCFCKNYETLEEAGKRLSRIPRH
jgi:aminotransferase